MAQAACYLSKHRSLSPSENARRVCAIRLIIRQSKWKHAHVHTRARAPDGLPSRVCALSLFPDLRIERESFKKLPRQEEVSSRKELQPDEASIVSGARLFRSRNTRASNTRVACIPRVFESRGYRARIHGIAGVSVGGAAARASLRILLSLHTRKNDAR